MHNGWHFEWQSAVHLATALITILVNEVNFSTGFGGDLADALPFTGAQVVTKQ